MNKLYERIDFENGTTPALNDTNLNAMSKAIDDIDDRVIEVSGSVTEVVPTVQELIEDAQGLKDDCETYATNASTSASDAESYAQQAAAGSGGNALEYTSPKLKLKRDSVVLSEVTIDSADLTYYEQNGYLSRNLIIDAEIGNLSNGQPTSNGKCLRAISYIKLKPNTTYTFSANVSVMMLAVSLYNSSKTYTRRPSSNNSNMLTFTTSATEVYGKWVMNYDNATSATVDMMRTCELMLEVGSDRTTYMPYCPPNTEITQINNGLADVSQATSNIMGSDAYSSTTTYAIGSCCIYENALYKAIQDNVVGVVPTNATYWEKVSLSSLVIKNYSAPSCTLASIPNNSWTKLQEFTLPKGLYILKGYILFDQNSNGVRRGALAYDGNISTVISAFGLVATNSMPINMPINDILNLTEPKTIALMGFQTSGGTLNITTSAIELKAIKLS